MHQGPDVATPGPVLLTPVRAWARLLPVMERLASSSDLDEILTLIVDSLRDGLGAERASVFGYDPVRRELAPLRAHGVASSLRFSVDAGIAGESVRTGRIINVPDCYADPRFNPAIDRETGFRTRCMLTIPLMSFDGRVEGVAQVLNKNGSAHAAEVTGAGGRGDSASGGQPGSGGQSPGLFDDQDEQIARALASQAAVAIRRAILIEAERRKNKMEADLRVAREIQQATVPKALPSVAGYSIGGMSSPAEETGGDAYDVFLAPRALASDDASERVILMLADAAGHGIGAALSVSRAHAMVRLAAGAGLAFDDIARHVNAQLARALPTGRFVSIFLGELDPATHAVRYIAAGFSPVVVLRAGGATPSGEPGSIELIHANAPPFGVDAKLEVETVDPILLKPGDGLLVLSDGCYELPPFPSSQEKMEAVLKAALAQLVAGGPSGQERAERVIKGAAEQVATFMKNHLQVDDQTGFAVVRSD